MLCACIYIYKVLCLLFYLCLLYMGGLGLIRDFLFFTFSFLSFWEMGGLGGTLSKLYTSSFSSLSLTACVLCTDIWEL